MSDISFRFREFHTLTAQELFAIYRLRIAVFVVEQNCPYQEADELDPISLHLEGIATNGTLAAYLRIIPPTNEKEPVSIGRVVVDPLFRNRQLGRQLMEEGMRHAADLWPSRSIRIGAQSYLTDFYTSLGFELCGPEYLEDGIPHVPMIKP
ncbi:MAG: GNAT family N-acetyltransferase [Flavobacteriales bacterium]|nr:GNAT family N-acetyltransferase [Flavobacteriales bacterium]